MAQQGVSKTRGRFINVTAEPRSWAGSRSCKPTKQGVCLCWIYEAGIHLKLRVLACFSCSTFRGVKGSAAVLAPSDTGVLHCRLSVGLWYTCRLHLPVHCSRRNLQPLYYSFAFGQPARVTLCAPPSALGTHFWLDTPSQTTWTS